MEESNSFNNNEKFKDRRHSTFNTESDPILFFHLLRKNLMWFALILVLCLISVFIYLRYTEPVYESRLTFQVGSLNTANQLLNVDNFHESNGIEKDIEILRSKLLFKRALSRLPIKVSYFNKGKILAYELYKTSPINLEYSVIDSSIIGKQFNIEFIDESQFELNENETLIGKYSLGELISTPKYQFKINLVKGRKKEITTNKSIFFVINNIDALSSSYINRLTVFPINASAKTINISFQDYNPSKAKDIVTAVADEYINYDIEERSKSSKKVLEFVDTQLNKYYNKLKLSENKIQEFQKDKDFKGLESSSTYFERTAKMEDQLIDLELQKSVLQEISNSINDELKNIDVYKLLPILAGTEYSDGITSLITELKSLLLQKENMLYEVTSNSEAINSVNYKINIQKKILVESIESVLASLTKQRENLAKKIDEIEKQFLNVPANELEYARLQRVLSIDEKFFSLLMEKRTEYSISEAGFVSQHTILDEAIVPKTPISPNKNCLYCLGLL